MNPFCQGIEHRIKGADHYAAMLGPTRVQGHEVTAIERDHHTLLPDGIIEHRFIRHGAPAIARVMRCFHIVPQPSQALNGLLREILVCIDPCHAMPVR